MKVSFLGDISLNDEYESLYQKGCKPFEGVHDTLFSSDLVIGNLECMAKGTQGENSLKRPRLKTSTQVLAFLKDLNLTLVTLAHNHLYDNLLNGFQRTVAFLHSNNIAYLGAGMTPSEARSPCIINRQGIRLCFLNYVTPDTNPKIPGSAPLHVNFFSSQQVLADIRHFRPQADHIIVLLHWGGRTEGACFPHHNQGRIARKLIDAGADLIVGGHSHTLQPFEIYKNKYIFYSLGNFCFADINFEGIVFPMCRQKLIESIIVTIDFDLSGYTASMVPISNTNLHIQINDTVFQKFRVRLFLYRYFIRHSFFWFFYYLYFAFGAPAIRFLYTPETTLTERLKKLRWKKISEFFRARLQ